MRCILTGRRRALATMLDFAVAALSQRRLSEISGVPLRTIQQYEQGQKNIRHARAECLLMLASALCCSVEELV